MVKNGNIANQGVWCTLLYGYYLDVFTRLITKDEFLPLNEVYIGSGGIQTKWMLNSVLGVYLSLCTDMTAISYHPTANRFDQTTYINKKFKM